MVVREPSAAEIRRDVWHFLGCGPQESNMVHHECRDFEGGETMTCRTAFAVDKGAKVQPR